MPGLQLDVVLHEGLLGVEHPGVEAGPPLLHQLHIVGGDQDAARAGDLLAQGAQVY